MRKNLFRTLLAVLLLSALFTVTAYAESAVVTGDNVNLRGGPGMNYRVVESVPRGAAVTVMDRSNSEWYAVTYNDTYGFMSANMLSLTANPEQVMVVPTDGSGRISAMYVRFRSAPDADASVLGEYNLGKELAITGTAGAQLTDLMIKAVTEPEKAFSQLLINRVSSQYQILAPTLYERVMAVLDYISGMTDVFALDLYRKINGMSLPDV